MSNESFHGPVDYRGSYPPDSSYVSMGRPIGIRLPNKLALFILGLSVPGTNYMYMGFMKKGLFYLSAFALSIYLVCMFSGGIFVALLPIIYTYSFFDAFRIRREMARGVIVEDNMKGFIDFVSVHRTWVFAGSVAIVAYSVLYKAYHYLVFNSYYGFGGIRYFISDFAPIAPVIIIGIIVFSLVFFRKGDRKDINR